MVSLESRAIQGIPSKHSASESKIGQEITPLRAQGSLLPPQAVGPPPRCCPSRRSNDLSMEVPQNLMDKQQIGECFTKSDNSQVESSPRYYHSSIPAQFVHSVHNSSIPATFRPFRPKCNQKWVGRNRLNSKTNISSIPGHFGNETPKCSK